MRQPLLVLLFAIGGILLWECGFGALFPWSPLKPGYSSRPFDGGTLYFPSKLVPPSQYAESGRLVQDVQRALHLPFRKKVRVIICSDWTRFNRGMLTSEGSRPQAVLGATLQTGNVIYLSPLLLEPQRDPSRALKHELCHALLYQNTRLINSFRLARLHWLIEGLAVSNGNADDYLPAARWQQLALQSGYLFSVESDPHIERLRTSIGAPFMLSEYRFFIEFLVSRFGQTRMDAYVNSILASADKPEQTFQKQYGITLAQADHMFDEAVRNGTFTCTRPRGSLSGPHPVP